MAWSVVFRAGERPSRSGTRTPVHSDQDAIDSTTLSYRGERLSGEGGTHRKRVIVSTPLCAVLRPPTAAFIRHRFDGFGCFFKRRL
jgi:hypothetical protein